MAAAVIAAAVTVGAEVVGAVIAGAVMNAAFWSSVMIKAAISAGMSLLTSAISEKRSEAPSFTSEARARTQLIRASTEPRRVIYGTAQVSGVLVYAVSSGESNKHLHLVIALAGHRVKSIGDVILNDEAVGALDAAGMVTAGRFAGKVRIRKHLGAVDQLPDEVLGTEVAAWGAKYRPLRGIAYLYVRLEWDRDVFPTGIPNIKAVVEGKDDILDPRTGLSGWTDNAALCQHDYIRWGHGMRCSADEVDTVSWIAAANVCDEAVALPGGGTQKRYTCNGTFTLDRNPGDTLVQLRTASAGALIYRMGKWYGYAGAADVAVQELTQDDLRGPLKVRTHRPRGELFNAVRGTYVNPDDHWLATDFPPVTNPVYEAGDGERIYRDVELPFTDDTYAAQRIAKIELERHRQQITGTFPAKLKAIRIVPWRPVKMSIPQLGWGQKLFRITRWKLAEDGGIDLDYEEYAPEIYDWNSGEATVADPAPNTALARPWDNLDIASVTLASGTAQLFVAGDGTVVSRIAAEWPAPANPYIARYLMQFRKVGEADWEDAAPVDAGAAVVRGWVGPVQDGIAYQVRVRAETSLGNRGNWTESAGHVVIGKSAVPSDLADFSATAQDDGLLLSWPDITDPDRDFYELRAADSGWGDDAYFARVKATQLHLKTVPTGTHAWYIKASDTSGNYSDSARMVTVTISAPPATSVRAEVVDNNVLLSYAAVRGTFPTATYEFRRGAIYATAEPIGNKDGLFTILFETQGGAFTYWVTPIDIAGNAGTPAAVNVIVNQPPDYVLKANYFSLFNGTLSNAIVDGARVIFPVNSAETFGEHFVSNGWATPQDQVDAGYPLFVQPGVASSYYEETFDYGTVLAANKISLGAVTAVLAGAVVIDTTISVSADGMSWTDYAGVMQVYATNFRYVKVRITATSANGGIAELSSLNVRLDSKLKTITGTVSCAATDSGGTLVYLTDDRTATGVKEFIDVEAIVPAAKYDASYPGASAVYDFTDTPNPLSMRLLMFDKDGNRISGTASYTVRGY